MAGESLCRDALIDPGVPCDHLKKVVFRVHGSVGFIPKIVSTSASVNGRK
jgi:hypothetical protein